MELADMLETDLHDDGELTQEERERQADDVLKIIDHVIASSPGVDADTIARSTYTRLTPELRESLAAGGDAGEQLTELRSLVEVEIVTRRVDE
jgi:glutamine synthetase adenylyltransferase